MLIVIMVSVIMLSVIMLSVIMLSVIMLSVILLSVIMLSVIMMNVVAPSKDLENIHGMASFFTEIRSFSFIRAQCYKTFYVRNLRIFVIS
jgi:hypothetical protein